MNSNFEFRLIDRSNTVLNYIDHTHWHCNLRMPYMFNFTDGSGTPPCPFFPYMLGQAQVARSLKQSWQAGWQKEGLGSSTSYDADIFLPQTNSSPASSAMMWMHREIRWRTKTLSSEGGSAKGCHFPSTFSQANSSPSGWTSSSFSDPEDEDSLNSSSSATS